MNAQYARQVTGSDHLTDEQKKQIQEQQKVFFIIKINKRNRNYLIGYSRLDECCHRVLYG